MHRTTWLWVLAIVVLAALAFAPATTYPFVDWDDFENYRDNEAIRTLNVENAWWVLTAAHLGVWQPVSWLVTMVEYQLFGPDPLTFSRGLHTVSILLHAVVGVVCFFTLRRLLVVAAPQHSTAHPRTLDTAAAIATLLFVVHPLRVELVAWASAQPYILALLFCLLTVWCYLRAISGNRQTWITLACGAYALSLMSKSIGVPLVAVLILLDWYPLARLGHGRGWFAREHRFVWLEKLPFALLAAAVMIIAPLAKGGAQSTMSWAVHGFVQRFAQACYGLVFYVYKTLLPFNLSPLYELRLPLDYAAARYVISVLLVVVVTLILIILRRRLRPVLVAALGYALLVFPVLGWLQSGNQEVADRYAYLPCLAWSALVAAAILRWWPVLAARAHRPIHIALPATAVVIIAALTALTWQQTTIWQSTASLWTHAVRLQPDSSLAQNGYGYVLMEQGRLEDAVDHFRRAIAIKADNKQAHFNLWAALRSLDRRDELMEAYRTSARLLPGLAAPLHRLGNAQFRQKNFARAVDCYRRALEREPGNAAVRGVLAGALYALGKPEAAIREARQALSQNPRLHDTRYNLALALRATGHTAEAIQQLKKILRADPEHPRARRTLDRWTAP